MILSDDPRGTDLHSSARAIASFDGEPGKASGSNCLARQTYSAGRVGAGRILRDADKTLYANLVVVSADPEGGAKRGDLLVVEQGGSLLVRRFAKEALFT